MHFRPLTKCLTTDLKNKFVQMYFHGLINTATEEVININKFELSYHQGEGALFCPRS